MNIQIISRIILSPADDIFHSWEVAFNTIFVSSHMYPENPEGTRVIVGFMNMGYDNYISDTAMIRSHNLFRPMCNRSVLSDIYDPSVPSIMQLFTTQLLSAALRSNAPIMFYLCLFFLFFLFFYSPFVLRNYSTDSHQIFRNCVFWCSLNNPIVFKFFGRHFAEKNAKNSENLVKISRVDSDFWQ